MITTLTKLLSLSVLLSCAAKASNTNELRQQVESLKVEFKKYQNDLKVKEKIQKDYAEAESTIANETDKLNYHSKYLNKLNAELTKLPKAEDLDSVTRDVMHKLYMQDVKDVTEKINQHKQRIANSHKKLTVLDTVWKEMFTKYE